MFLFYFPKIIIANLKFEILNKQKIRKHISFFDQYINQ